ncbi:MAG: hypothetical protein QOC63_3051 [Mycobacterium sp.]|nr:hypothetical protein [Mycobacterium sp.]
MNAAVAGFQTIAAWPDPPSRKQYAAPRLDQLNTRRPGPDVVRDPRRSTEEVALEGTAVIECQQI